MANSNRVQLDPAGVIFGAFKHEFDCFQDQRPFGVTAGPELVAVYTAAHKFADNVRPFLSVCGMSPNVIPQLALNPSEEKMREEIATIWVLGCCV